MYVQYIIRAIEFIDDKVDIYIGLRVKASEYNADTDKSGAKVVNSTLESIYRQVMFIYETRTFKG